MSETAKNFALLGVAGYIAPRHLKAIAETGNALVAACDPNESVGVLDRWFHETRYFREFERFDRHVEKLRRKGDAERVHYVSICSPNYLHDAHVRFALRAGADAICEKPLVINPWNLDPLAELEAESGRRVRTVLQLRLHPALVGLREALARERSESTGARKHEVTLTYVTARGPWYQNTWKGSVERSGGIATNIGIHFFDALLWLFGRVEGFEVHVSDATRASGYLELERATVRWYLSIEREDVAAARAIAAGPGAISVETAAPASPTVGPRLAHSAREAATDGAGRTGPSTFRQMTVDEREVEFSDGFADLHTAVYRDILAGGGFGVEDARPSITLAHAIRRSTPVGRTPRAHELVRRR